MFNMKRAILLAGMRLGISEALQFMPQQLTLTTPPPSIGRVGRFRSKSPPSPSGKSGQQPDYGRLPLDRASNVRKLQRWNRAGMTLREPDEKAKLRHAWYRREKAWEAYRASLPAAHVHPDHHTEAQRKETTNVS